MASRSPDTRRIQQFSDGAVVFRISAAVHIFPPKTLQHNLVCTFPGIPLETAPKTLLRDRTCNLNVKTPSVACVRSVPKRRRNDNSDKFTQDKRPSEQTTRACVRVCPNNSAQNKHKSQMPFDLFCVQTSGRFWSQFEWNGSQPVLIPLVCARARSHTHTHTHARARTPTRTHTHKHTHTHTHIDCDKATVSLSILGTRRTKVLETFLNWVIFRDRLAASFQHQKKRDRLSSLLPWKHRANNWPIVHPFGMQITCVCHQMP